MTEDGLFAPKPDEPVVTTVEEIENLCRIAAEAAVTEALDRLRALPLAERIAACFPDATHIAPRTVYIGSAHDKYETCWQKRDDVRRFVIAVTESVQGDEK